VRPDHPAAPLLHWFAFLSLELTLVPSPCPNVIANGVHKLVCKLTDARSISSRLSSPFQEENKVFNHAFDLS
jgi:hypothetical protein